MDNEFDPKEVADEYHDNLYHAQETQAEKGIEKYGTPLMTFNGRDAYQDAMEEYVDLGQYITQIKMERDWYKTEYERLRDA